MARMSARILAIVAVMLLAGCAARTDASPISIVSPDAGVLSLESGGLDRTVIVRDVTSSAVAQASGARVPALVVLHGASGTAARVETTTGFTELAAQHRFVVAYAQGTDLGRPAGGGAWDTSGCCGRPVQERVDDVGFLSAVVDLLVARHNVDPERVYLTGFSNGGMMTYRFACELGTRLAGIAVVGGALNESTCAAPKRLPVLAVHGTDDVIVPYDGGAPTAASIARLGRWVNASVAHAAEVWSMRDGCSGASTVADGAVETTDYSGCASGSAVRIVTIRGGTHRWPTTANERFDASAAIVAWFGLDAAADPFVPAAPGAGSPPVQAGTSSPAP